ncbi:hypothetical protein Fmac_011938 [Flemingia macrophylla]|uniref:Leucine-rich repeat-containing N-terminal plant-type domain-containing protein n=1 Tax=Flemingia macrophylla TaxID=520843 RepID=A0ABD1MNW2_9FABA
MGKCVFSLLIMMLLCPSLIATMVASSSINEKERQALIHSGWWANYRNISDHCHWNGISCNERGSVTAIDGTVLKIPPSKELRRIQNLNFTAFPSLVKLNLYGMDLTGTIPQQITTLTNLTVLDLSINHLHG